MKKQTTLHRSAFIAAAATLIAAGTVMVAGAQASDGCDGNVGPISESRDFTPYEARLSHLPDGSIATVGKPVTDSGRQMDGLPLRREAGDGDRASYQYFLGQELDRQLTVAGFRAAGGIQLDRDAVNDGDPYTADDVIAQVGDRAVKVQVGDYDGALVWADPESNGARAHHLYWSDGAYNYALIAVRDPQRMVQLARQVACSG